MRHPHNNFGKWELLAPLKGTNQGTKKLCNLFRKVAEPEFKPLPVRHLHSGALQSSDSQDSLSDSGGSRKI